MLTYAVALKSGGDYYPENAVSLARQIKNNLTIPHRFVCITDMEVNDPLIDSIPLIKGYYSSWSMIELYRLTGPVIISGLDVLVIGNIDELGKVAIECPSDVVYMATPRDSNRLKIGGWISALVVWNGDWSWLYHNFDEKVHIRQWKCEQDYIWRTLKSGNIEIRSSTDRIDGYYAFKALPLIRKGRVDVSRKLPEDARIITFMGQPRPHTCEHVAWVKEYYNKWL